MLSVAVTDAFLCKACLSVFVLGAFKLTKRRLKFLNAQFARCKFGLMKMRRNSPVIYSDRWRSRILIPHSLVKSYSLLDVITHVLGDFVFLLNYDCVSHRTDYTEQ